MIDPDFDPLRDLKQLQKDNQQLNDQIKQCILVINRQTEALQDLHSRLQLLEMARRYEDKFTLRNPNDTN